MYFYTIRSSRFCSYTNVSLLKILFFLTMLSSTTDREGLPGSGHDRLHLLCLRLAHQEAQRVRVIGAISLSTKLRLHKKCSEYFLFILTPFFFFFFFFLLFFFWC